jgi:transposase InsO family protein
MIDTLDRHPRPLGDAQCPRREAEQAVRSNVVELARAGQRQSAVAQALHLAPQTLSVWMDRPDHPIPRGRPATPVDPLATATVTEVLDSHGRSIGVPTLKRLFHEVPRSTLHRIREEWSHEQKIEPCCLAWTTPGSVWSADFTQPPSSIDGVFKRVLVVRDLASQCMLLAVPCEAELEDTVVFHLCQLFNQHAPPLVLKSDNGSPFIAADTRAVCSSNRVINLLSPPLTPQYNGSIEAAGGQLKTRAAQIAQLHLCLTWSSDILESARLTANALNRPWGPSAPTPDERWGRRQPITADQRASLATLIDQKNIAITQSIQRERLQKGLDAEITAVCRATVARTAIRQALVELGYLQIRRPLNMSTQNNADLSKN